MGCSQVIVFASLAVLCSVASLRIRWLARNMDKDVLGLFINESSRTSMQDMACSMRRAADFWFTLGATFGLIYLSN